MNNTWKRLSCLILALCLLILPVYAVEDDTTTDLTSESSSAPADETAADLTDVSDGSTDSVPETTTETSEAASSSTPEEVTPTETPVPETSDSESTESEASEASPAPVEPDDTASSDIEDETSEVSSVNDTPVALSNSTALTASARLSEDVKSSGPVTLRAADGTETFYNTLYEAVEAAEDGATILLNEDIEMGFFELNGKRTVPTMEVEGKSITLDGQDHTVTAKNEAFSMIVVRPTGTITVQNITLDGSSASNRVYSNIINVEGGTAYIEEGAILENNATNAVGIGTNVPGGTVTMNGGEIRNNVVTTGGTDTGAAVTVLTGSTFIMNGGSIHDNESSTGASGIMVNRGGKAILNIGTIESNATTKDSMGSAIHIKGGDVTINDATILNNKGNGYGSIYVTNHSSFDRKWDGVLTINGGTISDSTAIYLWSKGNIEGTAAYVRFSGSPTVIGKLYPIANGFSNLDFKPIEVTGAFTPTQPVTLDSAYDYIIRQTMVQYANGVEADSTQFIAPDEDYGYQKDAENNLLYTEQKRRVIFMDGENALDDLSYWEFVEDTIDDPEYTKPGYTLDGWYTDKDLQTEWNLETDTIPREDGEFYLYAKWSVIPAEKPVLPAETEVDLACNDADGTTLTPDIQEQDGHTYTYAWTDADGNSLGTDKTLTVPSPANGEEAVYTLTVTATRTDNGETAQASGDFVVVRAAHDYKAEWTYDENQHWHACTVCGEKKDEAAHTFEWVIDKQPTETEAGSKHEECTVCGYAKAAVEIPATGTTTPAPTVSPAPTSSPDATTTPAPTAPPVPTSSPDATTTPAPTASPDATTTPAPTGTPGATGTTGPAATPAPTAEPESGNGPKTGDPGVSALWFALPAVSGLALAGTVMATRRKKTGR